jgi:hypothetical protein
VDRAKLLRDEYDAQMRDYNARATITDHLIDLHEFLLRKLGRSGLPRRQYKKSAFRSFLRARFQEIRNEAEQQGEGMLPVHEVMRRLGREWRSMTDEEQHRYTPTLAEEHDANIGDAATTNSKSESSSHN